MSPIDTYRGGLFVAGAAISLFVVFSTILSSRLVLPDRLAAMPSWCQTLVIRPRTRLVIVYSIVVNLALIALSLGGRSSSSGAGVTLWRRCHVGMAWRLLATVTSLGAAAWTVVLWRAIRKVK